MRPAWSTGQKSAPGSGPRTRSHASIAALPPFVLARELTFEEVRDITATAGVGLEDRICVTASFADRKSVYEPLKSAISRLSKYQILVATSSTRS